MEESIVASISDSYQRLAADPGLLLAPDDFVSGRKRDSAGLWAAEKLQKCFFSPQEFINKSH